MWSCWMGIGGDREVLLKSLHWVGVGSRARSCSMDACLGSLRVERERMRGFSCAYRGRRQVAHVYITLLTHGQALNDISMCSSCFKYTKKI